MEQPFEIFDFKDEAEWLNGRMNGIGGSDASAVIGMNPYKSNIDLFEEKIGRRFPEDISGKACVIYGKYAEEPIRELFKLDYPEYKVEHHEFRILRSIEHPFMQASLDGELTDQDGRKGILEIKTTNILQSMQKEKWRDRVPDNYYIQVLHYLLVTGYEFIELCAHLRTDWGGEKRTTVKHYHIERAEVQNDLDMLLREETKFWKLCREWQEATAHTSRDINTRRNKMELRITNPEENGFLKEIQWNQEEVKLWVAARVQDYKTIAYTADQAKDMKRDRADLNKLKAAFEDERKRLKKVCMEPYNRFEQQVKEITALIDEPIQLIDSQLSEIEERRKQLKQKEIEELFETIGFQDFITLERIMDPKWLNATVSLNKIEEQMKNLLFRVGTEVSTINSLPEFSFEALENYKKTLDLNMAIADGQRLADIQKRKQQYEEEQKRIAEERARQETEKLTAKQQEGDETVKEATPVNETVIVREEPVAADLIQLDFRVFGTREQIMALRNYMIENQIKFGKVE